MINLDTTEAAFAVLATEYDSRKQLAEQQVEEWKWATWHVFDPKPLYQERTGYAPGRLLKKEPSEKLNCMEYGFDQEGRIVVARQYSDFGFYETFYQWSACLIESAHFDCAADKKPLKIELVKLKDGKAVRSVSSGANGCCVETYAWTGSQVTTIHQSTEWRVADETPELKPNYVAVCEHDDAEVLQRISREWFDGTPAMLVVREDVPFERVGKRIRRRHG